MTELLTDNLPLLAGAPNGIKKLRELILELAVRGKLVEQDASDEPASELLKRVAAEKARLVAEGKIKKQKPLSERDSEDPAFELPAGWAWARFADVVNVLNGRAYKKEELLDAGTPVLRVGNLFTSNHWYYSTLTLEEDKYCNPGDLLFAWSASFGPFIWHGERSIYHYHIWKLDFYAKGQLSKHYLYNYLLEQTQEIKAAGHGVSMVHMTKEKMEKLVVPVPPLAEQHRIVAKVDELMALCDRLEAQQADAASAHAQLVQALLGSLTQSSDATEFAANWQRLAEHFHTLFSTEPSIDALKQTLLQLAVMGKLVPQDPSDVPACELLKRIAGEKAQLVAQGKIKKQTLFADSLEESKPFEVPEAWEWCRVNDLISIKHGYAFSSAYFCESASPYVLTTPGSFFEAGGFRDRGDRTKYYCGPVEQEFALHAGDLIVAMTEQAAGLLGSTAFVPKDEKIYLHNQRLGKLIFDSETVFSGYIFHYFNGAYFRSCVADSSTGMKVKHTSPGKIGTVFFPLPPLAEQHRIVAKVDQLMALCDQLKTRLTQARQLNEQLASTLVEQAVA